MIQYVLCYVELRNEVLLIEKRKPAWQYGKYNLPGGKIEDGETPEQAAIRELQEETNLRTIKTEPIGRIVGSDWIVYLIRCEAWNVDGLKRMTSEPVFSLPIREALAHPDLISNLRTIIPLAAFGVRGWTLNDDGQIPSREYRYTFA